ncbi:(2Fe-2S)-binding protein [Stappia taiwanensis]|uniref:(2Fe-2S)-binding protein n=1 Tax=Stappia taiwanensis TaxID=992267 RepID=A0A838Y1V4_9HYPH|nr:(2Fe-2S)-binding protein [Stappia taiwanensis]MBA4612920.1 (2Fe-2S)-binding protein [Stappia taiwanensis]GGF06799.1 (2Fe-2S)-binding protein [Stappia taiwanensis]
MDSLFPVTLTLNGVTATHEVSQRTTLADFLRQTVGLTATHIGCEHGVCGACTVFVDGRIARACLMFAIQAEGRDIRTLEGFAGDRRMEVLQRHFHERNALQCGFCTSGMLATAHQLLEGSPDPSREEVRESLSGNFCRCTGYHAIVDATLDAAAELNAAAVATGGEAAC